MWNTLFFRIVLITGTSLINHESMAQVIDSLIIGYTNSFGKQGQWIVRDSVSGQVSMATYVNDTLNGEFMRQKINKVRTIVNFVNGKEQGWQRTFQNGKLVEMIHFSNMNEIDYIIKFRNGIIYQEYGILYDHIHGEFRQYDKKSRLVRKTAYRLGKIHGIQIYFHRNGHPEIISHYEDGRPIGIRTIYNKRGVVVKQYDFNGVSEQGVSIFP